MVEIPQTPVTCAMTGFALAAHPALVHVLFGMTASAFFRCIGIQRRFVTSRTACRAVLSNQWKGRGIVIDLHGFPVFRGVAALAAFAEFPLVRILAAVAGNAAHVEFVFVQITFMATGTCRTAMGAQQRKFSQPGMIETGGLPGFGIVAGGALDAVPALVGIILAMAVDAGLGRVVVFVRRGMATQTGRLLMFSDQRKTGSGMIESTRRFPRLRLVAALAVGTKRAGMPVIGLVAADAGFRCATVDIGRLVASGTFGLQMPSQQRISGFTVIESRFTPAGFNMAVAAGRAHGAFMDIIRPVAADASVGQLLLSQRPGMAGTALGGGMLATQDETRSGMVKTCLFPVSGIVAARTVGTQCSFMRILLAVAGHARRGCIAEFRRLCMACRTDRSLVRAGQIEIGLVMPERLGVELDNLCCTAFVIGVTGFALLPARLSVKALPCPDIGGDILMTASAQGALRCFLEGLMAGRTGRFRFGMRGDDFTGHQHLLQIAG